MFSSITPRLTGTSRRTRNAAVLLFALAAACAALPAGAQARKDIKVIVNNRTNRALTFEIARAEGNGSGRIHILGATELFTVQPDRAQVAPITDRSEVWMGIRPCPRGVAFALKFANPLTDYPDVVAVEDLIPVSGTRHRFAEGNHHLYWREHVRVARQDDTSDHKVFDETILHAPGCE
jgi:hypothetical protein